MLLGRLKQEVSNQFECSIGYIMSLRQPRLHHSERKGEEEKLSFELSLGNIRQHRPYLKKQAHKNLKLCSVSYKIEYL